jgi:pilus assembly protein CpaF
MSQNTVWNLINDLNKKSGITEISINGPKHIFVEKGGQYIQLNANIPKDDINSFVKDVADLNNKVCDKDHPILDGNLPDGSRVNIIMEPFVMGAPAISIRKYLKFISTFEANENIFGLNSKWVELFKSMIGARSNIVVSGGTGVGKTTFLNLLIAEIPKAERVITIEDTLELNINLPNVVRLESGAKSRYSAASITTRDLVKNTLRMRPDRIIIGETRGGELFDLLQAMNTGHEGSMTSVHSNSAGECLSRLETLFLLAGFEIPMIVVRKQISSAIDFIVQIGRNEEGQRVVTEVIELCGMEGTNILSQKILVRNENDQLVFSGYAPRTLEKLHKHGGLPLNFFEKL